MTLYAPLRGFVSAAAGVALFAAQANAAGFFTPGLPLATGSPATGNAATIPFSGSEQIGADTLLSGGAPPQSEAINLNQVKSFVNGGPSKVNYIIGGDAAQNLWQRGTTGKSVTTTTTYGGPDRFFYWSGSSTAMTVSRSSTAGDRPASR